MNGASENKERGNFKKEAVWDTGVAYTTSVPLIPPSFHPAVLFGWDWPHLSCSRGLWLIWAYQVILFLCYRGGQSVHSISPDIVIGHMTWGGPNQSQASSSPRGGMKEESAPSFFPWVDGNKKNTVPRTSGNQLTTMGKISLRRKLTPEGRVVRISEDGARSLRTLNFHLNHS